MEDVMDLCIQCGAELGPRTVSTHPYGALPGVVLVGVTVATCPSCGEEEVEIPRIFDLHKLLARITASRPGRLKGPEIRFLRKHLGWSGKDFARLFNTSPSQVSRWESGTHSMDARAEQLLRVSATRLDPIDDYQEFEELLLQVGRPASDAGGPRQARWDGHSWAMSA